MRGLTPFLVRGYILHRTRGHWAEMAFFSLAASVAWWAIRAVTGIILAIFSVLLLGFLLTR